MSVVGPIGTGGCRGTDEAAAPIAAKGAEVGVRIGPAQLGRPWCAGSYTARAIELQRAHCRGSTPCPQYIRVVAIVGTASFRVARG